MHKTCRTIKSLLITLVLAASASTALAMPKAAEDEQSPVTSAPAATNTVPAKSQPAPVLIRKEAKKPGKATPLKSAKPKQPEPRKTGTNAKAKRK